MSDFSVSCPVCGKAVVWQAASRWRPFCSDRCKMVDFGEWAKEERRIAGAQDDDDAQWSSSPADE